MYMQCTSPSLMPYLQVRTRLNVALFFAVTVALLWFVNMQGWGKVRPPVISDIMVCAC